MFAGCSILSSLLYIGGVNADLLVVLLKGSKILTSLREFTLLHTLADVPVDEGTLRVEEVKLVIEAAPRTRDRSGVRQHAQATSDLRQVATRDVSGGLVADTELEASWAPIDELDGTLRLDDGNRSIDILGHNIATVK